VQRQSTVTINLNQVCSPSLTVLDLDKLGHSLTILHLLTELRLGYSVNTRYWFIHTIPRNVYRGVDTRLELLGPCIVTLFAGRARLGFTDKWRGFPAPSNHRDLFQMDDCFQLIEYLRVCEEDVTYFAEEIEKILDAEESSLLND